MDPTLRAQACVATAHATLRIEGPEAAEALLEGLSRVPLGPLERGRLLVVQGAIRVSRGNHTAAVGCFQEGTALLESVGGAKDAAESLRNLALVFRQLGDISRALVLLNEVASRFQELSHRSGETDALIHSAQLHGELGDFTTALLLAENAVDLARTLDQPATLAGTLSTFGQLLSASGEHEQGLLALEEALQCAEATATPSVQIGVLGPLGVVLLKTDPLRARVLLERVHALACAQAEPAVICRALIALGDTSEGESAYRYYAEAAELADQHSEHAQASAAHRAAARSASECTTELAHWHAFAAAIERQKGQDQANLLARRQASAIFDALSARSIVTQQRITAARRDSDLLAITVHDLRNPLQVAKGYTELLAYNGEATDEIHTALTRIERILRLVEGEMGSQTESTLEVEDLLPLIQAIVQERQPAAAAKQQNLQFKGTSVSIAVYADRLFHAVDNLISNALKFSPHGSTITVSLQPLGGRVRIEVRDQGPGLNPEDISHIFEREARGNAMPTGGERSSGMGLYIARRMVERHGGKIGAEAGLDGALFWIELGQGDHAP
ncbi:MAG: ATP-binding protein [Myxococcota bacterium]|nr:ATP-binding protein [Myxococcota bacterium]